MRHVDQYQHLNETSKFLLEVDLEWVVKKVMVMNYGIHRFLSAFVRFRLLERPDDKLALGIEELLSKGFF